MNQKDIHIIESQIGYTFKNRDLLQQAFIRRSYSKENGGENNEVLEFIGDKVLDFIVVKILASEYGYFASQCRGFNPNEDYDEFISEYQENKLTEIKKNLTKRETLARQTESLDLAQFLIMGKCDRKNNVQQQDSVKEDLFEAILGAVAIDCNWDLAELQNAVEYMLDPLAQISDEPNYVQIVQEWSLDEYGELPQYTFREQQRSYYAPVSKLQTTAFMSLQKETFYSCELRLKGLYRVFRGEGKSKSKARYNVCKQAYEYLDENDMLWSIRDEIENPSWDMAINQLEILARRGYFSLPRYDFSEGHDENGNPVWTCECHIEEEEYYFYETAPKKKDAKKSAAYSMLMYVLGIED